MSEEQRTDMWEELPWHMKQEPVEHEFIERTHRVRLFDYLHSNDTVWRLFRLLYDLANRRGRVYPHHWDYLQYKGLILEDGVLWIRTEEWKLWGELMDEKMWGESPSPTIGNGIIDKINLNHLSELIDYEEPGQNAFDKEKFLRMTADEPPMWKIYTDEEIKSIYRKLDESEKQKRKGFWEHTKGATAKGTMDEERQTHRAYRSDMLSRGFGVYFPDQLGYFRPKDDAINLSGVEGRPETTGELLAALQKYERTGIPRNWTKMHEYDVQKQKFFVKRLKTVKR